MLGGYDQAKITGANVTLPFHYQDDYTTAYIISITGIKMRLKDGSNPSILDQSQGSAMQACVELDVDYMSIDQYLWSGFVD